MFYVIRSTLAGLVLGRWILLTTDARIRRNDGVLSVVERECV